MITHNEFAVIVEHKSIKHYVWVLPFVEDKWDRLRVLVNGERPMILTHQNLELEIQEADPEIPADLQDSIVKVIIEKLQSPQTIPEQFTPAPLLKSTHE